MNYRSRDDIISEILNAANGGGGGLTKTKIMYKAFLGHHQLQEYLMLLIENDLLHYDSLMHTLKTTEKGLALLQAYNQIDLLLEEHPI
jgi:predicted transcriptional regulator